MNDFTICEKTNFTVIEKNNVSNSNLKINVSRKSIYKN